MELIYLATDRCHLGNPSSAGAGPGGGWGRLTTSQVGPSDNTASCAAKSDATGRWNQSFLQAYGYTGAGQVNLKRLIFSQIQTDTSGTAAPPTSTTWNTSYGYDDEGYQTSVTYPMGQTHLTGLDFMRRPNTLIYMRPGFTIPGPITSGVTYNAADQMTSMTWPANPGSTVDPDAYTYPAFTETRTYNNFNQVAQIQTQNSAGTPSIVDLNYGYGTPGQNNGQVGNVASGLDTNFNEAYTYDQLNRLTAVTGTKNQTYGYDGWGNLTSKGGDGKVFNLYGDPYTNRLAGTTICYDQNGNLISITTACNNPEYSYDIQNRLVGVVVTRSGSRDILGNLDQSGERYYYTADNKRVSTARPNGNPGQAQVFYVYGAKGEIAAICTSFVFGDAPTCDAREPRDVKFAGRMIIQNFVPVAVDRLGSVVANPTQWSVGSAAAKYYAPFGEQYNEAASGTVFPGNTNFATHFHEETTGLNYADQRFYNSQYGRFMNADPYRTSAGAEDPGSWNKYSYVQNDPVNLIDPVGLCAQSTNTSVSVCAEPDFIAGVTSGGGRAVPNDPLPLTRKQRSAMISDLRSLVSRRIETDCQALAEYIGVIADSLEGQKEAPQQLKTAIAALTPNQFPVALIPGVGGNSNYVALNNGSVPSGFQSQYQDQIPNADQAHHFSAFFQLGFVYGASVGASAATWYERLEGTAGNTGDIMLGMVASQIGAYVRSGVLPVSEVAATVRDSLCK